MNIHSLRHEDGHMELGQESPKLMPLSARTSRNLSSSSSAFVSALESPFISPRSPPLHISGVQHPSNLNSSNITVTDRGPLSIATVFRQLGSPSSSNFVASDASPFPSICTSSNFELPDPVQRSPDLDYPFDGICNGNLSNCSQETVISNHRARERPKKFSRSHGKIPFSQTSTYLPPSSRLRTCDVYIGFHGRKPSLLRFANWLRAELEIQGISCFSSDRSRCRNTRAHASIEGIMNSSVFGVVILTRKSFANPYTIEELRSFIEKKNLVPIYFDLNHADCLARDIIERRGEVWEKYGGELWRLYGGLDREWKEAIDGLSRVQDWQLHASEGNWRDCILRAVILLAMRLGRRSVIDRVNMWRERIEKQEFLLPRNEYFAGRKKEISELELILFGYVCGAGEREYFELKTRHKQKRLWFRRNQIFQEKGSGKGELSEGSSKGKEPVIWKESEKEIEMQRIRYPQRHLQCVRSTNGGRPRPKKKRSKILYGRGIACVSGESGIGKTELVLEYAYRFSQRYKMVLWVGGESRYLRQNYLKLRNFLEVDDLIVEKQIFYKGKVRCFEEQEEDAITKVRKELMREIPFLVIIDNLENEKDWWDQKALMDLLPRFGDKTHFIITTRLPRVLNLEPMNLSYLSGMEALFLMRGSITGCSISEMDALRVIEHKLGRLPLGLGIVGAILSELPITPSRLLDTINRMPIRDFTWSDREALTIRINPFLLQLLDVCLTIFDHAEGPRCLATRMVQVSGWFAPAAIPVPLLAMAAHKAHGKHRGVHFWKRLLRSLTCRFSTSITARSEVEASSMLVRFGLAKSSTRLEYVHFHELIRLYSRKRGSPRLAQAMVKAVCLRGSVSHSSEHIWAACFLIFRFGASPAMVELNPSELLSFVKHVVLPLAISTFISFSRCSVALELLRLCTDALEVTADALVANAEKWFNNSVCCVKPIHPDAEYTYLWQELALLRATLLETRAKLMLRGGLYDIGDDLIRKAIFIRSSIYGEDHQETIAARETLSKLTRLLTNTPT